MKQQQQPTVKPGNQPSRFNPDDAVSSLLDGAGRFAFWAGLLATIVAIALILFLYQAFAGTQAPGSPNQALQNIGMISKLLYIGVFALIAGSTYMFWGEEVLPALQLIASGIIWSMPLWIPSAMGMGQTYPEVTGTALRTLQYGGYLMGGLSICVLIADVASRARLRAIQGAKAEALKYGKGMKEERDYRNVFMGKCWQLPFCRKFVREACPIYHSRRTCWRERVGCMCEEEVIRKAMEGRTIPKDMVAAAKFIPYNNKVPMAAKMERCRQCVIYNEHQKHKYKLSLWILVLAFLAFYVLLRPALLGMVQNMIGNMDNVFRRLTFSSASSSSTAIQTGFFNDFLLICLVLVAMAYSLKLLEYLIFKVKI